MRLVNSVKALRTLRKTSVLLDALLKDVTQAQAEALTDGPDGWSVVFIVCHLHDFEAIYTQRVEDMLGTVHPTFRIMPSNDEMVVQNDYAHQDLRQVLADLGQRRQNFIALLEGLTDEQWQRTGVHPQQGEATVLDVAINTGLHDVDHLEQMARCLKLA